MIETIERAVEVLNRNQHRGRKWKITEDEHFPAASGIEAVVEGDEKAEGLYWLSGTDAALVAQYYVDREPGGAVFNWEAVKDEPLGKWLLDSTAHNTQNSAAPDAPNPLHPPPEPE